MVIRTSGAPLTFVILRLCGIVDRWGGQSGDGCVGFCLTQPFPFPRRRCCRGFRCHWFFQRELPVIDVTRPPSWPLLGFHEAGIVSFGLIMAAAQWGVVAAPICTKDRRGTHRHIQQARQVVDADAGRRLMACADELRLASLGALGEQHGAWRGSEGSLEGAADTFSTRVPTTHAAWATGGTALLHPHLSAG
jgi:hypothetical protein